jgi:hypothetical protein
MSLITGIPRLGVVAATAATLLCASPVAALASAQACVSERGYQYGITKNYGKILDGKGTPKIYHNGSGRDSTFTLSQTESGTVDWSVNASITATVNYDFFAISGSVSATIGGSYAKSTSTSQTVSATITIPNNEYGILQGGVFRQHTYGHYFFDNGNCTYTTGSYIDTKIVYPSEGMSSAVNTTGTVPWDQQ